MQGGWAGVVGSMGKWAGGLCPTGERERSVEGIERRYEREEK